MQRYTIFFIAVNALHVSGGFSAHHQELKTVHTASGISQACLLLPLTWVSLSSLNIKASVISRRTMQTCKECDFFYNLAERGEGE
jgi:hypothetical protein